jgi:hypothetical protein
MKNAASIAASVLLALAVVQPLALQPAAVRLFDESPTRTARV